MKRLAAVLGSVTSGALLLVLATTLPAAGNTPGFHAAYFTQTPPGTMQGGRSTTVTVQYHNTGTETWQRGVPGRQANLGIPGDSTAYAHLGENWLSANRVATTEEASVPPGGLATFRFTVKAPLQQGTYRLPLRPLIEGVTWMEDYGIYVTIVSVAGYHAQLIDYSPHPTLVPGATATLQVRYKNTGTWKWTQFGEPPVRLGIPGDSTEYASMRVDWLTDNRLAHAVEQEVLPGETATFVFSVRAPERPGVYRLPFRPVAEGRAWMEDYGAYFEITSRHDFHAAFVDASPHPVIAPGSTASLTIRYRNSGQSTWERGVYGRQVNLAVNGDSTSHASLGVNWLSTNRIATTQEATVAPGATGTFTFSVRAPSQQGVYRLPVRPVVDGVAWLEDVGAYFEIRSDYGFHSKYVSHSPYPTLDAGQTSAPLSIVFRNTGTRSWVVGTWGEQANLAIKGDGTQWSGFAANWLSANRVATTAEARVDPGATGTFTFQVKAPSTPGTYRLDLQPVVDGATWMEDEGVFIVVTVRGTVPQLSSAEIQTGLVIPWDVDFAPDGRMFVTERAGRVRIYASGAPGATLLSTTTIAGMHATGEAGLMGITLDPQFGTNGYVYLCASRDDEAQWRNQVLRYRVSSNTLTIDDYVIRRGMLANSIHNGCSIRFGPDGKLWVTMGDANNTALAQDPNSLNGKILRVNWDGSVPSDNPILQGAAARTVAYTMGHRNPQGIAFQPLTGTAFSIEHGPNVNDEINVLAAGLNYGWPNVTGSDGAGGYADPAWASGASTIATSGGTFVTGAAWGSWSGSLFVSQLKESDLRRFTVQGTTVTAAEILFNGTWGRLRAARQAPDGTLYLTTSNGSNDKVIRITATQP